MARHKGHLTDLQLRPGSRPASRWSRPTATASRSRSRPPAWPAGSCATSTGGRRRELTIGRYPDIGLAEARGIATLKRAEVQQGRNPAAEKQKAKATAAERLDGA